MCARRRAGDSWAATLGPWLVLLWIGLWRGLYPSPANPATATWCDGRPPAAVSLERSTPRQLRALPGIGRGRARSLVEAGHGRGAALELADWSSLPGLGGRTLTEVRRALEARGP